MQEKEPSRTHSLQAPDQSLATAGMLAEDMVICLITDGWHAAIDKTEGCAFEQIRKN